MLPPLHAGGPMPGVFHPETWMQPGAKPDHSVKAPGHQFLRAILPDTIHVCLTLQLTVSFKSRSSHRQTLDALKCKLWGRIDLVLSHTPVFFAIVSYSSYRGSFPGHPRVTRSLSLERRAMPWLRALVQESLEHGTVFRHKVHVLQIEQLLYWF